MPNVTPSEDELHTTVVKLRADHPALGIGKLHAQLKVDQPTWAMSEKRFRKALQALAPTTTNGDGTDNSNDSQKDLKVTELVAETGLDPTIDTAAVAPKVKVKMFKGGKGKGLVARENILEGEILWAEDPWIVTADR